MSAYLFSALVNHYYKGHYVDACSTMILYGVEQATARKAFEEILMRPSSSDDQAPKTIEQIVVAPVLEQLLTETGDKPIQWPEIPVEILKILESTMEGDEQQGYWVDCDALVRPENLAPELAWLQRELPEEIRSGLNWSMDRSYFFLISILSPPATPVEFVDNVYEDLRSETNRPGDEAATDALADSDSGQRLIAFPQLAGKECAVVVRARNSVVGTWLWRRFAATTPLANNAIRVDPLCEIVSIGEHDE